jgi:hypothetical protein
MINLQSILAEYFVNARSNLDIDYDWDVPEKAPIPFVKGTDSCAQANIRLRRELRNVWITEPARRYELANWYVRVWGGIRRNESETIRAYCDSSEEQLASSTWKGIATWSKILVIRNPDKYAIYDARVGAAILALQLLKRTTTPILFFHVPSRNKDIKEFQFRVKQIPGSKDHTYKDYVTLLTTVAKRSGLISPEEIEMVLFAHSLRLVAKCEHLFA